jgi:hypothetical protein
MKSIMVEEIRFGMLSIQQSSLQYQLSQSVLQRWNRWYFKKKTGGAIDQTSQPIGPSEQKV